jgi:hypothetical protein
MGVGSLFPFCRGHSEYGSTDHEPWSFGEEVGSNLAWIQNNHYNGFQPVIYIGHLYKFQDEIVCPYISLRILGWT